VPDWASDDALVEWDISLSLLDYGLDAGLRLSPFTSSAYWASFDVDWVIFPEVGAIGWASFDVNWVIFAKVGAVNWASSDVNWFVFASADCVAADGLHSSSSVYVSSSVSSSSLGRA
jgi:hypothetical protein